jgi:fructokinase
VDLPNPRIGIDLGGTKIAGIVLDVEDKTVGEARTDTPREDYRATLAAIAGMVEALKKDCGAATVRVGLGIPGSIGPKSGRVQNANSTWLNGRPLADDLAGLLRDPLRIENDANCFALSEAADGAAAGARSVFGVILGTGCGGGLVLGGRLVNGPRAICGEWGHVPLPWPRADEMPGPRCWCGLAGCMESWLSGPALERDYAESAKFRLPAPEIAARAASEPLARAALVRHVGRLARGLAAVVNILDPEVIVLGGGLSNMAHLYTELPGLMAPYIFSDDKGIDIRRPAHGPESGARGAARLWDEQ